MDFPLLKFKMLAWKMQMLVWNRQNSELDRSPKKHVPEDLSGTHQCILIQQHIQSIKEKDPSHSFFTTAV